MTDTRFHLSFAVPDLAAARAFYGDVLGCAVTLDKGTWLNLDFFGHQITMHQAGHHRTATALDHFGPIVPRPLWNDLAARCRAAGAEFKLLPTVSDAGGENEHGKFVVRDPAGNLVEIKFEGGDAG